MEAATEPEPKIDWGQCGKERYVDKLHLLNHNILILIIKYFIYKTYISICILLIYKILNAKLLTLSTIGQHQIHVPYGIHIKNLWDMKMVTSERSECVRDIDLVSAHC